MLFQRKEYMEKHEFSTESTEYIKNTAIFNRRKRNLTIRERDCTLSLYSLGKRMY